MADHIFFQLKKVFWPSGKKVCRIPTRSALCRARLTICITRNLQHMLCLCCVCVVYIQWFSIGFERKSLSAMYIQWIKNVFSLFKTHVARIYKIYNGYVAVSMRMYSWIILKIKLFSVFSNMFFIKRVKIPASIQQKTFLSSCKRLRIPVSNIYSSNPSENP